MNHAYHVLSNVDTAIPSFVSDKTNRPTAIYIQPLAQLRSPIFDVSHSFDLHLTAPGPITMLFIITTAI